MSLDLGGVTYQLMGVALDAAMLRHEVIANNIANHDTPGYRARRLSFENHFNAMAMQLRSMSESALESRINALRHGLRDGGAATVSRNETVELDHEMVCLTENTLRYQAILKAASKRGELLSLAINGGRR